MKLLLILEGANISTGTQELERKGRGKVKEGKGESGEGKRVREY